MEGVQGDVMCRIEWGIEMELDLGLHWCWELGLHRCIMVILLDPKVSLHMHARVSAAVEARRQLSFSQGPWLSAARSYAHGDHATLERPSLNQPVSASAYRNSKNMVSVRWRIR